MKKILQKNNQNKRQENTAQEHMKKVKKVGKGVDARGKKWIYIYLKLKKENNIRTMVLKTYL